MMIGPSMVLDGLHGEALDAALATKFTLADERVVIGSGGPQRDVVLRKPANADHLISEADYVMDERLPYWADLWPSARVLAGHLLTLEGSNRRLLEMGCGLGLASIAALLAGFEVTSTDYYEDALHVTRANAARVVGREPSVRMVNWRHWPDDLGTYDVVIAADVLYEKEYATLVGDCLVRALAPNGVAILADPGRLALPAFREHLPDIGLSIRVVATVPFEEGAVKQQVQVMEITRKP